MTMLATAAREYASRPMDQRFPNLPALLAHCTEQRQQSKMFEIPNRALTFQPTAQTTDAGLLVYGPKGEGFAPTHWAFGQLCSQVSAPAAYLRSIPAPLAADCLNHGLHFGKDVQEYGVLLQKNGSNILRASTSTGYGRVWNSDIAEALVRRFGDGVTGHWRVPGMFGKAIEINQQTTTIYASDRDMFVFLADEDRRIEMPNRRNGQPGSLARGFYIWNSEVGSATFGIAMFLFDYVCSNRCIWGVEQFKQVKFRHTSGAPARFIEHISPLLRQYSEASALPILDTVKAAQAARLENANDWLAKRWNAKTAQTYQAVHAGEEGRPIESLWDVVTAMTAYARDLPNQDSRVEIEQAAGLIMDLVAVK